MSVQGDFPITHGSLGISPLSTWCCSCGCLPCRCYNPLPAYSSVTSYLQPFIDHDLLAAKIAEKLLLALDPEHSRKRAKAESERSALIAKLRAALDALS